LKDFHELLKKLNVLQYTEDTEYSVMEMIDQMLEQIESLYEVPTLGFKVVIFSKLALGL
jgi:hypothetical protein